MKIYHLFIISELLFIPPSFSQNIQKNNNFGEADFPIDIDEKPEAIEDLYKFQNGGRTIPMIVYPDQDHQVNPRPNDVLKKIASLD